MRPPTAVAARARAAARARRPPHRHRLRPGTRPHARRGGPTRRCSTGFSTATATRSSSAATAPAVSPRCCTPAAARATAPSLLDSPAGPVAARIGADGEVSVDMGVPDFDPRALPFEAPGEADSYPLEVAGQQPSRSARCRSAIRTAVLRWRRPGRRRWRALGPAIERHARFPRRVNVGFLEIVARGRGAAARVRARRRRDARLRHRRLRGGGGRRAGADCSMPRCA